MEIELGVGSEDYSEFSACETAEQKLCFVYKRKATTTAVCVKKEEKANQRVSRKVLRKGKEEI